MIQLQKFSSTDYDILLSWIDSEELLMQFAGPAFTFPLTADQLDRSLNDRNRYAFKVIQINTKAMIGYAEICIKENTACLCRILIGDKSLRGKGIGQKIVEQLLEYAFAKLDQQTAELNVYDWNTAAIKCYEKLGFEINPDKKSESRINEKIWISLNMHLQKEKWIKKKF
ncbi:GNAT family N-acetyltransferase [Ferruginibacter sp. SUN002]|uniref:GNAT family N-acetyltransferase n=1 Tax=Ferruginibacter sp. SUN002 TaxID=2937789 RepID=UPI003D36E86A